MKIFKYSNCITNLIPFVAWTKCSIEIGFLTYAIIFLWDGVKDATEYTSLKISTSINTTTNKRVFIFKFWKYRRAFYLQLPIQIA